MLSIFVFAMLLAGCSGPYAAAGGPGDSISASVPVKAAADPENGSAEAEKSGEAEPAGNAAEFHVDVTNGTLTARLYYQKSEKMEPSFLLNRDFTVSKLVCDGEELAPDGLKKEIEIEGYAVNQYELPQFNNSLYAEYTGVLTGKTGISPYVRETIAEDFTILRWETFCYPLFAHDWDSLLSILNAEEPLNADIRIRVPESYLAVTPFPLTGQESGGGDVTYIFNGDMYNLNCAISQYQTIRIPSGEYYFLPGTDLEKMDSLITPVMDEAQKFPNETFGTAEVPPSMRYIEIPDMFGSYAITGRAVFIQESAFESAAQMGQLIHEFIHLGWNAQVQDRAVQRCRFFDEGFTSYLNARVQGHLLGDEVYEAQIEKCRQYLKSVFTQDKNMLIPVTEYGRYEQGGLSYDMGPVFFDELSKIVGVSTLDQATKAFLEEYRDKPADFEILCGEYSRLCGNAELDTFFQEWLYSTEGIERVIKNI